MNKILKDTLLKPLLERVGTASAVLLVAGGDWLCANFSACGLVTHDGALLVTTWVVAAALVLVDLVPGWVRRLRGR